jgi:medium-chain acyl-[acyl-carrier-protein] hydrolase
VSEAKRTWAIDNYSKTMQTDERIRTDYYHVGWQDVDCEGRITMKAITQMLQDSAWKHTGQLGVDFMESHQNMWVMFRLHIQIVHYPGWDQKISVTTWSEGLMGMFIFRDFEVRNQQNELLISAASEWLVLGMENMKPKKPNRPKQFLPDTQPDKNNPTLSAAYKMNNELAMLDIHRVNYAELDMNQHVNTSNYIDWIVNHIPISLLTKHPIEHFNITFMSECNLGHEIMLKGNFNKQPYAINGIRKHDSKTVFASAFSMKQADS